MLKLLKSAHGLWKGRAVGMHSYQCWYAFAISKPHGNQKLGTCNRYTHTNNERCSNITLNVNIK